MSAAVQGLKILVFYGSYRSNRSGIRLANYLVRELAARGNAVTFVDAKELNLPIIDKMYKEYPAGTAPPVLENLATQIKAADAFLFVTGEYNWGPQPGLKNLTDHFLEEWFFRPAAIVSYSAGRLGGVRSAFTWRNILGEMGMVVVSSQLSVGGVGHALTPDGLVAQGDGSGEALALTFPRFAEDLEWWAEAARRQRTDVRPPPY